jgi:hypothetical protein
MLGFRIRVKPLAAAFLAAAVAACAGQAPQPLATIQPDDANLDCPAIYAEISSNNQRIEELGREQGWKVERKVAVGVAVPVLWFGMNWQGTVGTEAKALQDRQSYFATLATQRHCGGGQQPPRSLAPPPAR